MVEVSSMGGSTVAAVENAAEREFGKEFEDIHILSNAQVAVILQVSARSAVTQDEELNEVYRKTQKYVERFKICRTSSIHASPANDYTSVKEDGDAGDLPFR